MKNNKKGFTLMEMLIVVAIIAVLVAIAIPVLSGALEKSREAADAANIRSAYAEVMILALEDVTDEDELSENGVTYSGGVWTKTVTPTQTQADWQNTQIENIGGLAVGNESGNIKAVVKGVEVWEIKYTSATNKATITPTVS